MDMKIQLKRGASKRNTALIALLLLAVGALFYQNVVLFAPLYSVQEGAFLPSTGAPLLSAGEGNVGAQDAIAKEDAQARTAAAPAPMLTQKAAAPKPVAIETYNEKGILQDPVIYYGAVAILGLMLLLNIFKVSFQSSAVFDSDIFKTLSSETRVEMLYSLQQRRKTLSELAADAKISLPGAKQHLELLEAKGLVRKLDEGRKWKYYELTSQGKGILAERFA
ncbi:MAG: winged helix-turn-helix domain-containing protein [Candidatus Micrarchaeota archaeon]